MTFSTCRLTSVLQPALDLVEDHREGEAAKEHAGRDGEADLIRGHGDCAEGLLAVSACGQGHGKRDEQADPSDDEQAQGEGVAGAGAERHLGDLRATGWPALRPGPHRCSPACVLRALGRRRARAATRGVVSSAVWVLGFGYFRCVGKSQPDGTRQPCCCLVLGAR